MSVDSPVSAGAEAPPVPRASATVLLLRDAANGLEVYMLRRHEQSNVLGGAYVFPGGKLDQEDCEGPAISRLDRPPAELTSSLAEEGLDAATGAGLFYAACRETFEEAKVLFAHPPAKPGAAAGPAAASAAAWAMMREGIGFGEVLEHFDLTLACSEMVPWSRWITPVVPSLFKGRRFDTRFFVAALPEGQDASHDEHEAVAGEWINPRRALERYVKGEFTFAPPQIMSFMQLAARNSAREVLDAARATHPRTILPQRIEDEGDPFVCYPGDARHDVHDRAMIGPTRLIQRGQRFEPPGGIERFLDW